MEVKTVYEAKPIIRDLQKEAVSFVPAAVRMKLDKTKGIGGLMEPEEADRLEKEGYLKPAAAATDPESTAMDIDSAPTGRNVTMEDVQDEED